MWFKQIQLFQLIDVGHFSMETLLEKLSLLAFVPCFPSMPKSAGWVSPVDEDNAPLVEVINGNIMLCLQIEEKILPSIVVRQALYKKIKEIETTENRSVRQNEKLSLKDEIMLTLLPRAFSKLTRVHAYIDVKNNWIVVGTKNEKQTEQLISMFKKSISENVFPFKAKDFSTAITYWLTHKNYPSCFSIEKSCVLQDPNEKSHVVRCQQQDLFASSIQSLIKEGCVVKQLAISWYDRVELVLSDDLSLGSIKFQDEVTVQANDMEAETKQQQFNADFLIMAGTLDGLLKDILSIFITENVRSEIDSHAVNLLVSP